MTSRDVVWAATVSGSVAGYTLPMRYLAIDLGDVRTGLAVGSDSLKIASPAGMVEGKTDAMRIAGIKKAINEHWPDALVIGLPLNMDDSEGPRVTLVRAFAKELEKQVDLPVHLVDERLTSAAADEAMSQTGFTRGQKKARRDALAAAAILRNFFESMPDDDNARDWRDSSDENADSESDSNDQ